MDIEKVKTVERPEIVENKHLVYLDELRESGVTNMYGATPYLQIEFNLDKDDARTILKYWMDTF